MSMTWKESNLHLAKIVILIWCMVPIKYNGSEIIFKYTVLPLFKRIFKMEKPSVRTRENNSKEIEKQQQNENIQKHKKWSSTFKLYKYLFELLFELRELLVQLLEIIQKIIVIVRELWN